MKAILFDLDETILDRSASLREFCRWQAQESLDITDVKGFIARFIELDQNGSVWKDKVYGALKEEFAIHLSTDALVQQYVTGFSRFCREKPGALKAIREIAHEGYKLGLISNGKSPFQENNLSALGVAALFDAIVVSEAVGCRKPEPAIFELASKELSVSPEKCIFVGDSPIADIRGAANVGMYTVFIPSDLHGAKCSEADAVCRCYSELLSIIENA